MPPKFFSRSSARPVKPPASVPHAHARATSPVLAQADLASAAAPLGKQSGGLARFGFDYLPDGQVYLDSACQTLRPQPVIEAMNRYFTEYNACGERVKYDWGRTVDAKLLAARSRVLKFLGLSAKHYSTSFTLNTTYGINLLLSQLPQGRYSRVITTHTEHNSVFLSTMACARQQGLDRFLLDRDLATGQLLYEGSSLLALPAAKILDRSIVVISAMNNVTGDPTVGLAELIALTHARGGIVIVDAAQAVPHDSKLITQLTSDKDSTPDAICFSAHKTYGASLGVVAASNALLESLDIGFIGGGQVAAVRENDFTLMDDLHTRLEPGLQAWGEIIALEAALEWMDSFPRKMGTSMTDHESRLSHLLYDSLIQLPNVTVLSQPGSALLTISPHRVSGHQLAGFLSKADIMVRSGYFCAHHWIQEVLGLGPLVRFSLGAHNTDDDIGHTVQIMTKLMKGL